MVQRGRAGERPPSMADVASRAGVSHQTVSRVLNDSSQVRPDTRERVLAVIEEVGYRRNSAARLLATNRSGRIGMVCADLAFHGPAMIASSLQEAGHGAGYEVSLLGLTSLDAPSLDRAVDRLLDQAVEAVVVAVAQRETREHALSLDLSVPVVLVQGVAPGDTLAAGIDQQAGAVQAVDHLLGLGHRDVVHVTGPLDWIEAQQRRVGWREALGRVGVSPATELVGDWSTASGYAAGLELARDPRVTAVFAANDAMAFGVLRALHEAGRRVPEDVSVVGFDDVPEAAYWWPSLTTVDQEFSALGRTAVDLTLRALAGETAAVAPLLAPQLRVRGSTGPVAGPQ